MERSFADAKELHGHRYARMRGMAKVQEQSLLRVIAQNLKKIANLTGEKLFHAHFKLTILLQILHTALAALATPVLRPIPLHPRQRT